MAGVAGPMLRSDRAGGTRLLAGLLIGEAAAGVLLAVPAYLLAEGVHAILGVQPRLWILAGVCVVFGVADLANRTPHVWRQVPQRLIWQLEPGKRGLAWGVDLGLLFTTQKVVSLIWLALAAGVLLDPSTAAEMVIGIAVLSGLTAVVASFRRPATGPGKRLAPIWRRVRLGSGAVMLALCAMTAAQAWQA